jgi:hypothetical protein
MKLARALPAAVLALAVLAPPAGAHNVKRSPAVGDSSSTFSFRGTAWQPRGRVTVEYYSPAGAAQPARTYSLVAAANGRFRFRFALPLSTPAYGVDQRMCFTQYDTRGRAAGEIGRRFRKCKFFYVEPPTARFWPSSGPAGSPFLLVTSGWYPAQRVRLELTRPDGVLEVYDLGATRSRGAYVAVGPPFGRVFVRRGGTLKIFPGDPGVLVGDYLAVVTAATGGAEIRTRVTVVAPRASLPAS